MANSEPFRMPWFVDAVSTVLEKAKKGAVVVCGGPGVGKSELINALKRPLEAVSGEVRLIGPNDWDLACGELCLLTRPTKVDVNCYLLDDLDKIICQAMAAGTPVMRQTIHAVQNLIRWREAGQDPSTAAQRRLVCTTTVDFHGPRVGRLFAAIQDIELRSRSRDEISPILLSLAPFSLEPWKGNWERAFANRFNEVFEKRLGKIANAWEERIAEATGGHPRLIGTVVEKLENLCGEDAQRDEFEDALVNSYGEDTPDLRADIQSFIEDNVARSGMGAIRSSLRRLRESTDPEEKASYEALLKFVEAGGSGRTLDGMNERAILMEEGLLYRDSKTRAYVIPGELITQEVKRHAAPTADNVTVIPSEDPGEAGILVFASTRIELKGNLWRVLKMLWDKRGEFVKIEELTPDPRNSLQRLREELGRYNCAHLIENKYRAGYRFIPRP